MAEKMADFLDSYENENKKWLKRIEKEGERAEKAYKKWREQRAYEAEHIKGMIDVLSEDTYNSNNIAAQMIRNHMPEVYALNANYAAYEIDKRVGFDTNFQLYDKATVERLIRDNPDLLPDVKIDKRKDKSWNGKKLRNEITQGILQGESVPKMAKRLERVMKMDENMAIRNARTATTSAQNGGRLSSFERAKGLGIGVRKVWIATMDGSTRHSHRALDGQERPTDEPFDSEHGAIMYPGDPYADPAEVYNCRCRLGGLTKYSDFDARDLSKRFSDLPPGVESYEDWVNMKDKQKKDKQKAG